MVTEGNWLLLDRHPWSALGLLFDLTVFLPVELDTIRTRIVDRWLAHGFTRAEAERRATDNDLPNAQLALELRVPADIELA